MDGLNQDLDRLLMEYCASVPVPEASAHFMPKLWERIDARRLFARRLKKLSQVFVGAAAVICLAMTGMSAMSSRGGMPAVRPASYLDALAEAHPAENLADVGIIAHSESPEARH